eukprot:5353462-Prymnesium_polylepis.1
MRQQSRWTGRAVQAETLGADMCHARLGDVGREHHLGDPTRHEREDPRLLRRRQRAVQRQHPLALHAARCGRVRANDGGPHFLVQELS